MRFRVHFAEREPREVEANEVSFTGAGGVIFKVVETEERTNPQNLNQRVVVPIAEIVLLALSAASGWVTIEPIEVDDEGAASGPAPLEEVYAR